MLHIMPDSDFKWLNKNDCCNMGLHLNYANNRFAIIYARLFYYHKNKKDSKNLIYFKTMNDC